MSWLQEQDRQLLEFALQRSSSCYLSSALEGTIYWVNDSFSECMGYTPRELERRTWMDLSLKDDNFEADVEAAKQLENGGITSYSVMKFYLPKGGKPQLGWLNVQRYPQYGPLQVCICHWDPVKEDASPALAISTKAIDKMQSELQKLSEMLSTHVSQSLFESTIVSILKLGIKYPKASWVVFVTMVIAIGGNAGFDLLVKILSIVSPVKAPAP